MFFDLSATQSLEEDDFCMREECDDSGGRDDQRVEGASPTPSFYSVLPSSPIDQDEPCFVVVDEQRHHIHSLGCSPTTSVPSLSSLSSATVVRGFSAPPRRVTWREHMRDVQRANLDESIHRLTTMRGGIEKKRRGKGGLVGGVSGTRRTHRPGCAMHVWSLVKHIKEHHSDGCSCAHEASGVSDDLVDRLRRLTRFDHRVSELARPQRFTYSYKLDYSLPPITEDRDGDEAGTREGSSADLPPDALLPSASRPLLGRISRSVSPEPQPSRPHCSSPAAPDESLQLQLLQLQPPVLSEEEMCARLSALPIGYHSMTTVASLESALHSSLSLMETHHEHD